MNIEMINAEDLISNPRDEMSKIFVEGWYEDFKRLCKDKNKLRRAFEHIFTLENFYVAQVDKQIMAFVAVCDRIDEKRAIHLDAKIIRKYLGFFRGSIATYMLTKVLIKKKYPFQIPTGTGVIEFVATLPEARGKGLAGKTIEYAMEDANYQAYILEVVDTNHGAIKLYERLGFEEFTREKSPFPPKHSGFEYLIYMKREINVEKNND